MNVNGKVQWKELSAPLRPNVAKPPSTHDGDDDNDHDYEDGGDDNGGDFDDGYEGNDEDGE